MGEEAAFAEILLVIICLITRALEMHMPMATFRRG